MIHNRRLKIDGEHSGALPPAIALAVSGGASRNVYIGNPDESWSEERLRQDFRVWRNRTRQCFAGEELHS
jgi:hypothetical protein